MKIVVLVKRVLDTASIIKIGADNKSIIENNFKFVINPYDEYAIEEALKIKEEKGAEVVIVSAGKVECKETIRTALAMGANYAIVYHFNTGALTHAFKRISPGYVPRCVSALLY